MDKPESLIAKIKKLLQLADTGRNSNIAETAAAAAKAQKLMEKHRIHRAMLEDDAPATSVCSKLLTDNGRPENWKLFLTSILAKYNGCYVIKSESYQTDNKIFLAGILQDINNIQHLYTYLVLELNRLCLAELIAFKSTGFQPIPAFTDSFYVGAITVIEQRLQEANLQARSYELNKAIFPEEKALVTGILQKIDTRVDQAKKWIKDNLQAKIGNVAVTNSNPHGYDAGQRAAQKINLQKNPRLDQDDKKI